MKEKFMAERHGRYQHVTVREVGLHAAAVRRGAVVGAGGGGGGSL